jgi:hypothetical protein
MQQYPFYVSRLVRLADTTTELTMYAMHTTLGFLFVSSHTAWLFGCHSLAVTRMPRLLFKFKKS